MIYVPKHILAFKVFAELWDRDWHDTPVEINEYPWGQLHDLKIPAWTGKQFVRLRYSIVKPEDLNLLQVFVFWLGQEILKFALEIPDYQRYLLEPSKLEGRQAAGISSDGRWEMNEYSTGTWRAIDTKPQKV